MGGRGALFAAWLLAVKTAMDLFPQLLRLGGIVGIRHALRHFGQFVPWRLTFARQLKSKLDYARLFCARQLLDLFDDAAGGHKATILDGITAFK